VLDLIGKLDLVVEQLRCPQPPLGRVLSGLPGAGLHGFKDLRDFIQEKIKAALGGIEFPRARQDEVSQMLALEARLAPLLAKGQPIPARLTRLRLYSATWLLHQFKTAPEAELLERCNPEALPTPPPPAKRRRQRRRRPAGDGKEAGRSRRAGVRGWAEASPPPPTSDQELA
jgi:hypothetical protein